MITYYMLGEVSYTYNDSTYDAAAADSSSSYGNAQFSSVPLKLFKTKEAAARAAATLTARFLKGTPEEVFYPVSFSNYFWNIKDIIMDKDKFFDVIKRYRFSKKDFELALGNVSMSSLDSENEHIEDARDKLKSFIDRMIPKMKDSDLVTLIEATNVRFFVVHPVEVAEAIDLLTSPKEWERDVGKELSLKDKT